MTTRSCRRCLLLETIPGLRLDASDLCDICQFTPSAVQLAEVREQSRLEMEAVIAAHRSNRKYECIVAYSGGKDSSYTLKLLVGKYGLRCIAITVDNGFLAGRTLDNCRAICSGLGVDHVLFTPEREFMARLYRTSAMNEDIHSKAAIRRASSMCNSCINLINVHMIHKALELDVPLIAGGYLGGQLPRDSAMLKIRPRMQAKLRSPMVHRFVNFLGEEARAFFELYPATKGPDREITVINPMLGLAIREEEIIASLAPLGWQRPVDSGVTSTNCRLNDLGVYVHQRRHGFHPYAFEIAEQVRHGLMSQEEAAVKLAALPTRHEVAGLAHQIGLEIDAE